MPITELMTALWFYLITSCCALLGLPITLRLFQNQTLAWAVAKPLGLIMFGYAIWLLASLHVLDYQSHWLVQTLFAGCAVAASILVYRYMRRTRAEHKERPKLLIRRILLWEAIGVAVYLAYLFLRAHNAEINGTERFMDMAFLAASGKTHSFPFVDPWYGDKLVNYYYYGSYLMSLLGNLAHVSYALTYTLALGFLYSLSTMLTGALVYAISRSKIFAVLGAILLTTSGTLFFAGCALKGALATPATSCSYASSTRLYTPSYIINEIPSYSFTVGDLHAHLLALPFFILALLLLYSLWQQTRPKPLHAVLLAVILASSGLMNAWDLITLSCLTILVIVAKMLQLTWGKSRASAKAAVLPWLGLLVAASLLTALFLWPGLRHFQNPVLGLGFAPSFVAAHNLHNVQWPTPLAAQLGMWGILIAGILYACVRLRKNRNIFILLLGLLSLGIIVGVEFVFIKDIYSVANPPYFRANTTFKFGYHAWTMLCIGFAGLLGILWTQGTQISRRTRWTVVLVVGIALVGGLVYPIAASRQFYLGHTAGASTINGAAWIARELPEDSVAIQYINTYVRERSVIAEAVGDSYTHYGRVTTFTGNITPMGWQTHEWTWRFQGKEAKKAPIGTQVETGWGAVSTVAASIKRLYETTSQAEAEVIIRQYGIQYIYVGNLERTTYPSLDERKFMTLAEPVFRSGNSVLYKVNDKN